MSDYMLHPFIEAVEVLIKDERYVGLYNLMTHSQVIVGADDWAVLQQDPRAYSDSGMLEPLVENDVMIQSTIERQKLVSKHLAAQEFHSRTLKFKVTLNRTCNFRCRYCIDHTKTGVMTPETGRQVCEFARRQIEMYQPLKVILDFSGGETFLNFGLMTRIASELSSFCRGKGIEFDFSLVTNGSLLTVKKIKHLQLLGMKEIRVSFAGPQEIHDQLRIDKQGKGTYATIVRNLQAITPHLKTGISVLSQYRNDTDDYKQMLKLMDTLSVDGIFINMFEFSPIMPPVDSTSLIAALPTTDKSLFLKHEVARRGYPAYTMFPEAGCAVDLEHVYFIDYTGALNACPAFGPGEKTVGDVTTGVDFVAKSQLRRKLPEHCLNNCNLAPVCTGNCRLFGIYAFGNFNAVYCPEEMLRPIIQDHIRYSVAKELGFRELVEQEGVAAA